MGRVLDRLVTVLVRGAEVCDVRSSEPIVAAWKRARRGTCVFTVFGFLLMRAALYIVPESPAAEASALAVLTVTWLYRAAAAVMVAAGVAWVISLYFFVRYVCITIWPEKFADPSNSR